jgi:hypothetical protein
MNAVIAFLFLFCVTCNSKSVAQISQKDSIDLISFWENFMVDVEKNDVDRLQQAISDSVLCESCLEDPPEDSNTSIESLLQPYQQIHRTVFINKYLKEIFNVKTLQMLKSNRPRATDYLYKPCIVYTLGSKPAFSRHLIFTITRDSRSRYRLSGYSLP